MPAYDISRIDFDPRKHYAGVRMQQGRVLSDDDWNENERIDQEERRRSRAEIIGPYGSPDDGFRIGDQLRYVDGRIDFDIQPGTIHLGGLRLEMEARKNAAGEDILETYRLQRDWLQQPADADPAPTVADLRQAGGERLDLVYLDAWQQAVCAVEDESLFEVALGGPDTATRLRTMRQVRIRAGIGADECAEAWHTLVDDWQKENRGTIDAGHERHTDLRFSLSFDGPPAQDDLCSPAAAGGYLGAENQAIRIQLTDDGHFTWGFDNASHLYRARLGANGLVTLLTEPKDLYHAPIGGQTVELLPWFAVLPNEQKIAAPTGYLTRVLNSYHPETGELSLELPPPPDFGTAWQSRPDAPALARSAEYAFIRNKWRHLGTEGVPSDIYIYVRLWHRGDDTSSPAEIPFTVGTAVDLGHTGLRVTIRGQDRLAGDFCVAALRPETPHRLVPWALEQELPSQGVRHFFAPLAILRWFVEGEIVRGEIVHDCRPHFNPLTAQDCCCTYTVGDGVRSRGDFQSIETAIRHLPAAGGRICVLPGIHTANAELRGRANIRISGCGRRSIVRPHPDRERRTRPVFALENCRGIRIDELFITTFHGTGIEVIDSQDERLPASEELTFDHNLIIARRNAINIRLQDDRAGANRIEIAYNQIGMIDQPNGEAAIFSIADDVRIERNRIVVVPPPRPDDPRDPRSPNDDDPGRDPWDPCDDRDLKYPHHRVYEKTITRQFSYVKGYVAGAKAVRYRTWGGIQIGSGSERVRIIENEIIGGGGNGITLGHLPELRDLGQEHRFDAYIYDRIESERTLAALQRELRSTVYSIEILENQIYEMGLNGIGVPGFFELESIGLLFRVQDLIIYRNDIRFCALQIPDALPERMLNSRQVAFGGIVLAAAENVAIEENRIEGNGRRENEPICGVFFLYGEDIEVSRNRILFNGPAELDRENRSPQSGPRGGIVVASTYQQTSFALKSRQLRADATPALKVHDNLVVQPLGHALFAIAFGSVSVVNNQFTAQGIDRSHPYGLIGGAVLIFNLGFSKDWGRVPLEKILNQDTSETFTNTATGSTTLRRLQLLPDGKVLFAGNQTTLDLRSPENTLAICAQLIFTLDDIGFCDNQAECAALFIPDREAPSYDIVLINTLLAGVSVRASDNRFTEGFTPTLLSLFSYSLLGTAVGNQSTHCIYVFAARRAVANNIVLDNRLCADDQPIYAQKLAVPERYMAVERANG